MTLLQHSYDILTRSLKTVLAVYAACLALNIFTTFNVSSTIQNDLAYFAFVATALLNIGLKVHTSVTAKINAPSSRPPVVVSPTVVPPSAPAV